MIIKAFIRIDAVDDLSYPASFLMSEVSTIVPVIASFFIGELTAGSDRSQLFGGDYFTYAVLGLAIAAALQGALGGFGHALQRAQERGILETFLVEPVPWTFLPIAMNVWRIFIGLFNTGLILFVGWFLGADYDVSGWPLFLLFIGLGILSSQAIGIVSASVLVLAKRSQAVIKLYTLAASLLAGSVFSVDQLPAWLKAISWLLPHTYVITAARQALMIDAGTFTIPTGTAIAVLSGFTVVVMGGGMYLFQKALNYARKMGMLSGY